MAVEPPGRQRSSGGDFASPPTPTLLSPSLREALNGSSSWIFSGLRTPSTPTTNGARKVDSGRDSEEDADWEDAGVVTPDDRAYGASSLTSAAEDDFVPVSPHVGFASPQLRLADLQRHADPREFIATVFDDAGTKPGHAADMLDSLLARLAPGQLRNRFEKELDEAVLARCLQDSASVSPLSHVDWFPAKLADSLQDTVGSHLPSSGALSWSASDAERPPSPRMSCSSSCSSFAQVEATSEAEKSDDNWTDEEDERLPVAPSSIRSFSADSLSLRPPPFGSVRPRRGEY
jgi:hypothetical protein